METHINNHINFNYYLHLYYKLFDLFINFNRVIEKENETLTLNLQENIKYKKYISWLRENGVIYDKILNYPTAFGPFGLVGVSSKEEIQNYQSLVYIPKKVLIITEEIINSSYLSLLFKNKEFDFEDDSNIYILTIFLIFEYLKEEDSFFKPYIDMIDLDSPLFWDEDELDLLDDNCVVDRINYHNEEIEENFDKITNFISSNFIYSDFEKYIQSFKENKLKEQEIQKYKKDFSFLQEYSKLYVNKIDLKKFKIFYNFVMSRNFMVNDKISQLAPFADSLNHSIADVYYEFYDSANFVSKMTLDFDDDFDDKIKKTNHNLFFESVFNDGIQKENYEKSIMKIEETNSKENLDSIYIGESNLRNNIEENEFSSDSDNENLNENQNVDIKDTDYFIICSGPKQKYFKKNQVYNFYGYYSNESLIANYGFVMFLNKYDKLRFLMNYQKNKDIIFEKLTENLFPKNFVDHSDSIIMKFKLKIRKIDIKFLDFIRLLILYEETIEQKELSKLAHISYEFNIQLELKSLNRALEVLVTSLTVKSQKFPIHDDIIILNDIINKKSKMSIDKIKLLDEDNTKKMREYLAISFRITQKFIILFNIKCILFILNVLSFSLKKGISVEKAFEMRYDNFDKNDFEYKKNRKVVKKYFLKFKFNI